MVLALIAAATAFPYRSETLRFIDWEDSEGRIASILIVKFTDDSGIHWNGSEVEGTFPDDWLPIFEEAQPRFSRSSDELFRRQIKYDPEHRLADLRSYVQLVDADVDRIAPLLAADDRIEHLYLAFDAVPPPVDISPETPDFTGSQGYLGAAPDGFDVDYARFWPNGDAEGIRVGDVEYSWDPSHEDLAHGPQSTSWGWDSEAYSYHGNGVLGEIIGGDNGYGIRGMSVGVEMHMLSPYALPDWDSYNVADAIENSTTVLEAGDILLIEQQSFLFDNYCPVEVAPDVFDAISHVVAQDVVVVEPGGNGAQDLDAGYWQGWFDREFQDSGAIMVGGGAAPNSGDPPRTWFAGGSSYGSRVDLQGWYTNIVTAGGEGLADLFHPDWDDRQAYTAVFGGTSGASPMIVSAAAIANAIRLGQTGTVWDPMELRAALRYTGVAQPSEDPYLIGPQPDLRRFLWTFAIR